MPSIYEFLETTDRAGNEVYVFGNYLGTHYYMSINGETVCDEYLTIEEAIKSL